MLSLRVKLTFGYSILIVIVSAAMAFNIYLQLQQRQQDAFRGRIHDILSFSVPILDGTTHSLVTSPSDMNRGSYRLLIRDIAKIADTSPIIQEIYTIRQTDTQQIVYVIDPSSETSSHSVGDPFEIVLPFDITAYDTSDPIIEEQFKVIGDRTYWRGYAPITDTSGKIDGFLVIEVDASEIADIRKNIIRTSVLIFVIIAPLPILAAIWLTRQFTVPINSLIQGVERITAGDLNHRVTVYRNDELGVLAKSFNQMSQQLSETIQKLDEQVENVNSTNKELRKANARTREAARLKSEFMATMSHELRTPLNAILGFAGIMLEGMGGEIDEDARHMVGRIQMNSDRLLKLINDVLDIARIEAGRIEIQNEPFHIRDLVQQWRLQTSVLAEQKNIEFITMVEPEVPETLYGDTIRLTQIVNNLLSNAFKFTEVGNVQLIVKSSLSHWQIRVIDSGIGIPSHALNYIFDEFRQVDGSTTRAYGGTGLGLAITRNLCLMMGGSIQVESTLQKGSTFTVTLPVITEAEKLLELVP